MALTPERIQDIATDYFADQWGIVRAAKMIEQVEAEVRKQDTELIRQMLDALERCTKHDDDDYAAIAAARTRLGEVDG